jgi:hypothetical protein
MCMMGRKLTRGCAVLVLLGARRKSVQSGGNGGEEASKRAKSASNGDFERVCGLLAAVRGG